MSGGQIFLLVFAVLFIVTLLTIISIFLKGFQLRGYLNNDSIKSFTRFVIRIFLMPNHPIIWGSLGKT